MKFLLGFLSTLTLVFTCRAASERSFRLTVVVKMHDLGTVKDKARLFLDDVKESDQSKA